METLGAGVIMKDQDLPFVKHFPDDFIIIEISKEEYYEGDEHPYHVTFSDDENTLFDFMYKTIEDAELAFKMMCRGV